MNAELLDVISPSDPTERKIISVVPRFGGAAGDVEREPIAMAANPNSGELWIMTSDQVTFLNFRLDIIDPLQPLLLRSSVVIDDRYKGIVIVS